MAIQLLQPLKGQERIIYSNGFENNNGSFTVDGNMLWQWGTPTTLSGVTVPVTNSGAKCWKTNLTGYSPTGETGSITSAAIALPTLTTNQVVKVRFSSYINIDLTQKGQFLVSPDGITWRLLGQYFETMNGSWSKYEYDLTEYAGGNIYLRFVLDNTGVSSTSFPGFYIDDISVAVCTNAGDATTFTLQAQEDPNGYCPWLFSWDGTQYVKDNDIFSLSPSSLASTGIFRDAYRLEKPLVAVNGKYKLKMQELDNDETTMDYVSLVTVDHAPDVNIAPDDNGNIYAYRPANLLKPITAISDLGVNVLGLIDSPNDTGFDAFSEQYVTVDFGAVAINNGARLVIRMKGLTDGAYKNMPFVGAPGLSIQYLNSSNVWTEAGRLKARFNWSTGAFEMSAHLPDFQGETKVRLYSISFGAKYHTIDFVGIETGVEPTKKVAVNTLSLATLYGKNIITSLNSTNNQTVQLYPSNHIPLEFDNNIPLTGTDIRDFVFITDGNVIRRGSTYFVYTWDGSNWVNRASYSFTGADETKTFDLSSYLPDPDNEYKVRVWQNYTAVAKAAINYVGMTVGTQAGNLVGTDDLRNLSPLISSRVRSYVAVSDANRYTLYTGFGFSSKSQGRNRWSQYKWNGFPVNTPPVVSSLGINGNNFTWSYSDAEYDPQVMAEAEVWTGSNATGDLFWDGPVVNGTSTSLNYTGNAFNFGDVYYLRIRVYDGHAWSGWTELPFVKSGQLSLSSPVNNNYNLSCHGGSDGSITSTITGAVAPYNYLWNTGATTDNLTNVPAGRYSLTVTDFSGKVMTETILLTEPPAITLDKTISNITCNGGADGSITISVVGGLAPYTYKWSNGATTQSLSLLSAGSYTITVTDANGCTASETFNLTEPDAVIATITPKVYSGGKNVSCKSSTDGEIQLEAIGGTSPYTFLWNTGDATKNIFGLSAGTYTVAITDSKGCTGNGTVVLTAPDELLAKITAKLFNGGNNISCFGSKDGEIALDVTGGNMPYNYVWLSGETTKNITGLGQGSYAVTIVDVNGCTVTSSTTLASPDILSVSTSVKTYNGGYNVSCNAKKDGEVNATINGGTLPYTYLWSNGSTSEDLTSVGAGSYSLSITDGNGCSISTSVTLTEPTVISTGLSAKTYSGGKNISCNGSQDGEITLTVSGGITPYSYSWVNGSTTKDITGLGAGNYSVVVMDANQCPAYNGITLTQPDAIMLTLTPKVYSGGNNVSSSGASDGAITLSVVGGTTPYTYLWSNASVSKDISGLTVGSYSVTVTDAHGCTGTGSVILTGPTSLIVSLVGKTYTGGYNTSCNGIKDGAITLTVSGGTGPYSYKWSNGSTSQNLSGLAAGKYDVAVKDANNNVYNGSITLTEATAIIISSIPKTYIGGYNVSCNGTKNGSIDLSVKGGAGTYTYLWSTGEKTQKIDNLGVGDYSVVVKDASGCSAGKNVTLSGPTALIAEAGKNSANCASKTVTIGGSPTAIGGTASYTYSWTPSTGLNSATVANPVASPTSPTVYQLKVTDANGCIANDNVTVANTPAPTASITYSGLNTYCNGITLTAHSSTSEGSYLWSTGETTQSIFLNTEDYKAGNYSVNVTDKSGCTSTSAATYTYAPAGHISSYTIIAKNSISFEEKNIVQSGSIGVTSSCGKIELERYSEVNSANSFVKAKYITLDCKSKVANKVLAPAVVTLPAMEYNTNTGCYTTVTVCDNHNATVSVNNRNITIGKNCNVTVTGTVYGTITIGENSQVTFTQPVINLQNLNTKGGTKFGVYSYITFNQDTKIRIKNQLNLEKHTYVNPVGYNVIFFIEKTGRGNCGGSGDIDISGNDVYFYASINMPNGTLHIEDDEDYYSHSNGRCGGSSHRTSPTYMIGQFIVADLESEGNEVYWMWHNCKAGGNPNLKLIQPDSILSSTTIPLSLKAYPNPFSKIAVVEFSPSTDGKSTVEVLNIYGQVVKVLFDDIAFQGMPYSITLDGSDLNNGVYYIRLVNGEQSQVEKMILVK